VVPQPPQFVGSDEKSAQPFPHMRVDPEQLDEQLPLLQTWPPVQA
jgi:hypothetical protein